VEKKKQVEKKKEESIIMKIVKPITLDNGIMISSLNELKDTLPTLEATYSQAWLQKRKRFCRMGFKEY